MSTEPRRIIFDFDGRRVPEAGEYLLTNGGQIIQCSQALAWDGGPMPIYTRREEPVGQGEKEYGLIASLEDSVRVGEGSRPLTRHEGLIMCQRIEALESRAERAEAARDQALNSPIVADAVAAERARCREAVEKVAEVIANQNLHCHDVANVPGLHGFVNIQFFGKSFTCIGGGASAIETTGRRSIADVVGSAILAAIDGGKA